MSINENCLCVLVVTKTAKVSVSGVGLGLDPAGLGLGLGLGLPGLDNISGEYPRKKSYIPPKPLKFVLYLGLELCIVTKS